MTTRHGASADTEALPSVAELQGLLLLKRVPAALALGDLPVEVPRAEAPSLEGLTVAFPAVAPITEEDLLERFSDLRIEAARRRDRKPGERVAMGDEVQLDVLGCTAEGIIPFSARADWWVWVMPEPLLPGFFEALVGREVGASLEVDLLLPPDYLVESLRGVPARFLVSVKAARELTLPDGDAPAFLASLGRGATMDEVMERLAQELADERHAQAAKEARELALELLADRCSLEVPTRLIDEELRRRWAEGERPILMRLGLSPTELQEALDGWLKDPLTRAEAGQRLKIGLVLGAIAERDQLQPRREDMEWAVGTLTENARLSRKDVGAWLRSQPAVEHRLHNLLMHLAAVEHVMSKVTFTDPQ